MKLITVDEFLEQMKDNWDCVDMVFFNYKTRDFVSYWVNTESIRYDKEKKRIHFKDMKNNLRHNISVTERILVDKRQIWNGEETEYIMNLDDDKDITFQAIKTY